MLHLRLLAARKDAATRYRDHVCPVCIGPLAWIPEAPGSVSGKACANCKTIFTDEPNGRVWLHPYFKYVAAAA